MLTCKNDKLSFAQRRSLSNALTAVWTMRGGLMVQIPENLDRLCELVIKVAGVDETELEKLPVEDQTAELILLARSLIEGNTLAGEASAS